MNNKKVVKLLNTGLKFETLKILSESQIDVLYGAIIKEQEGASAAADEVAAKIQQARQMTQQLKNDLVGEEELEENEDGFEDLTRQDYTGQEGPHDEDDMAPDGMDNDSDNNRSEMGESEIKEKFRSKAQQKYFFAKCEEEGPKSKWCKMADEFSSDTKDFGKLPEKVKESNIRQIEESLISLIRKYIPEETMTKKDLLKMLEQSPGTKEAPIKTPTRTKPERKSPYKPKHKPAPKAGETETAPSRVKPGTKQNPVRKTPYQPKHKPAPKAVEKELPSFLKFNELNIKFRDE
jgi:hypothetical protein